ncbi:hypothetical protein V5O39_20425 [Pseudomonas parakoreensis]
MKIINMANRAIQLPQVRACLWRCLLDAPARCGRTGVVSRIGYWA